MIQRGDLNPEFFRGAPLHLQLDGRLWLFRYSGHANCLLFERLKKPYRFLRASIVIQNIIGRRICTGRR